MIWLNKPSNQSIICLYSSKVNYRIYRVSNKRSKTIKEERQTINKTKRILNMMKTTMISKLIEILGISIKIMDIKIITITWDNHKIIIHTIISSNINKTWCIHPNISKWDSMVHYMTKCSFFINKYSSLGLRSRTYLSSRRNRCSQL